MTCPTSRSLLREQRTLCTKSNLTKIKVSDSRMGTCEHPWGKNRYQRVGLGHLGTCEHALIFIPLLAADVLRSEGVDDGADDGHHGQGVPSAGCLLCSRLCAKHLPFSGFNPQTTELRSCAQDHPANEQRSGLESGSLCPEPALPGPQSWTPVEAAPGDRGPTPRS